MFHRIFYYYKEVRIKWTIDLQNKMCYDEKRDGEKWKEGGKLYEKKKLDMFFDARVKFL